MNKIVFISGRLGGGGSERVLTLIANDLKEKGEDVSIITFGNYKEYANNYKIDCKVYPIRYKNDIDQIIKLRNQIKLLDANIIIAFEYYIAMKTILACYGLKGKVIVSERNDPHKLDKNIIKKLLRNILYKKADYLVCQTNDAARYFSNLGINNTVVIMNPVKSNLPTWKGASSEKVIVNFCRLEKQKNLLLLINSFSIIHEKYPEFKLYIYGEGNEENELKNKINDLGLQDSIKIFPFSKEIHSIISNYYMFVSSSDYEGLSNSMLEAMAIGLPVICTDCPIGGANMVIQHNKNGFLVPVNNEKALVDAMFYYIENPNKIIQISMEEKKVSENFSLENIVKEWRKII